jgi:hypothetical protein
MSVDHNRTPDSPQPFCAKRYGLELVDRLVHHAEVLPPKGDSYRLKDKVLGRVPTDAPAPSPVWSSNPRRAGPIQSSPKRVLEAPRVP